MISQYQHHWVLVSGQYVLLWVDAGPHVNSLLSSSQEALVRRGAAEMN